jgi:hypothetical protein
MWTAETGALLDTIQAHTVGMTYFALSDLTNFVATASGSTVKTWSTDSGLILATITHDGTVLGIDLSPEQIAGGVYMLCGPEGDSGGFPDAYCVLQPDTDLRVEKIALTGPGALGITGSVILHFAQRVRPVDLQPSDAMATVWNNASAILTDLLADPAFQGAKPEEISMTDESDPDPFVAVRVSVTLAPIEPEAFDS